MLRLISKSKRESKAASREKGLLEEELDLSAAVAAFRLGWRDENSVDVEVEIVEGEVEGDVVE